MNCSLREAIIREAHGGELVGHFDIDKTLILVSRCVTCHKAKTHENNVGLYTPLPIQTAPWEDVSMNFIVGLSITQRGKDSILVVVDKFFKMAHFVVDNFRCYLCC